MQMYLKQPGTSFWNKTIRLVRVLEDHILWPVNWFVITLGVSMTTIINQEFARTTLGYSLPRMSSGILSITLVFLAILLIVEIRQRPPRPETEKWWKSWTYPFEFVLMPIVGFFFSALPGLDAHTRLMLGRYLEYRVTEKVK